MLARLLGFTLGNRGRGDISSKPVYYYTQGMHAYCLFRAIEWLCVQFAQVQLVTIIVLQYIRFLASHFIFTVPASSCMYQVNFH